MDGVTMKDVDKTEEVDPALKAAVAQTGAIKGKEEQHEDEEPLDFDKMDVEAMEDVYKTQEADPALKAAVAQTGE